MTEQPNFKPPEIDVVQIMEDVGEEEKAKMKEESKKRIRYVIMIAISAGLATLLPIIKNHKAK